MLTALHLDEYMYAPLTAWASPFLLKDVSPERLVAAARHTGTGAVLPAPSIMHRLVGTVRPTEPAPPLLAASITGPT